MTQAELTLKKKLDEQREINLALESKNRQLEIAMMKLSNEANAKLKKAADLNNIIQEAFAKNNTVKALPEGIPAGAR